MTTFENSRKTHLWHPRGASLPPTVLNFSMRLVTTSLQQFLNPLHHHCKQAERSLFLNQLLPTALSPCVGNRCSPSCVSRRIEDNIVGRSTFVRFSYSDVVSNQPLIYSRTFNSDAVLTVQPLSFFPFANPLYRRIPISIMSTPRLL